MNEYKPHEERIIPTPADLIATEEFVERQARADRARPGPGFEERLFSASRAALHGEDVRAVLEPIAFPLSSRSVPRRYLLAAGVMLAAGVGIAAFSWFNGARSPVASGPVASNSPSTVSPAPIPVPLAEDTEIAALESDLQVFLASAEELAPLSDLASADQEFEEDWEAEVELSDDITTNQDGI